jgi:hypothetical protein
MLGYQRVHALTARVIPETAVPQREQHYTNALEVVEPWHLWNLSNAII